MATSFMSDTYDNGKKFKIIFETDEKENFDYMLVAARECIDGKPLERKIEKLRAENAYLGIRLSTEAAISKMLERWDGGVKRKSSVFPGSTKCLTCDRDEVICVEVGRCLKGG